MAKTQYGFRMTNPGHWAAASPSADFKNALRLLRKYKHAQVHLAGCSNIPIGLVYRHPVRWNSKIFCVCGALSSVEPLQYIDYADSRRETCREICIRFVAAWMEHYMCSLGEGLRVYIELQDIESAQKLLSHIPLDAPRNGVLDPEIYEHADLPVDFYRLVR